MLKNSIAIELHVLYKEVVFYKVNMTVKYTSINYRILINSTMFHYQY